jgi:hypothetical protein
MHETNKSKRNRYNMLVSVLQWDRYAYRMRNVPQAEVNILVFTHEHTSEFAQDTTHKLGGRERRDASRRSRILGMVLADRDKVEDVKRSMWREASSGSSARKSECCFLHCLHHHPNPRLPFFLQPPAKVSNLTEDSALHIENFVVQVSSPTYNHAHMAKIY